MAVLGSTNLTGCNSIPDFIAAGSLMLFQQSTAPINWTKQTTHDNKALRVVTGTATPGGTSSFTSIFSPAVPFTGTVGDTTLSTPQIPIHTHTIGDFVSSGNYLGFNESPQIPVTTLHPGNGQSGPAGGGGSHTHPFSGFNLDFAVAYVDVIICSKN